MNCSSLLEEEYIPTMEEAVAALGELSVGLVILGGIVTTGMFCIFVEELIYIYRHWPVRLFLLKSGCLCVFPVVGFCFFLNLLVPRATSYTTPTVVLCLPAPMVTYFWVVVSYARKEKKLIEKMEEELIPLQGPPFCCVFWCCPKIPFTRRKFKVVKAAIYQYFLAPVVIFLIATICSYAGVFKELKFVPDNAAPYLMGLNMVSFFIGVYGLVIFTRTASKLLTGFHIRGKFVALQLHFILIRFHFIAFDTLGRLGFFPCHPPVSSLVTALYIRSALLLGEGFILSVVGRFFFLHAPPPHFQSQDTAHPIS